MHTLLRAGRSLTRARVPRICILDGDATLPDLERVASLGFDHVLLATAPADVGAWAAAARPLGLSLLVDVNVDEIPAESAAEDTVSTMFVVTPAPMVDPRQQPRSANAAIATVTDADDAERLAEWWATRVADLTAAGAAGVRLLGLASLPAAAIAPFLVRLRGLVLDAVLFAWTPGLAWDSVASLPDGAVDYVACSLPWWDGQADWIWRELGLLRRIAPVIAPAGEHTGGLAALLADGWMRRLSDEDGAEVKRLNALRTQPAFGAGPARLLSGAGQVVRALLRTDAADPRQARQATLFLLNSDAAPAAVSGAAVLPGAGSFGPWLSEAVGEAFDAASVLTLPPGALMAFTAPALPPPSLQSSPKPASGADQASCRPRLAIEVASPCVDGGRFPSRRTVGDLVEVEADIIADGHDKLAAVLRWRGPGEQEWHEVPMRPLVNDRWTAAFPLRQLGVHHYAIQAWRDAYATFADELTKKHAAGVPITLEVREGALLVAQAEARAAPAAKAALTQLVKTLGQQDADAQRETLLSPEMAALMASVDDRPLAAMLDPIPVQAERVAAGFAAWYEVFPRSMSDDPNRHGTFADMERHLPRIHDMGFDVLYFPPVHPIGRTNRKGRNNSLTPTPDDPGSPYAIGSPEGGHDALHPELGTIEDFQHLRAACAEHGLELAIDFAIQCSPDHPWLKQHRDWFNWRPDGSIRYAENPPKKYEDIVNVDFYAPGAIPGLWNELRDAVLYWAGQGVRLFRVDNPHTKPLPFWEWMIAEVQARYPDSIFLAEAFTRPKVMYRLAKVGFSQSYTYFTWRNTKAEFQEYLMELTQGPPREFFRPNFFVNTPDINPVFLQTSGRPGFLIRAALAATLSGLWGVYNGFELCEGTPIPGKEEYLDSEKYQLRAWDWDRPGNIAAEITQLNAIRRLNPALHSHLGVTFLPASGDQVLFFEKATKDRSNVLLIAISMDPRFPQYAELGILAACDVTDLLGGRQFRWTDRTQRITLTPDRPYAIWRIRNATE
jgi:starch synthase (maltosyl-transferring)